LVTCQTGISVTSTKGLVDNNSVHTLSVFFNTNGPVSWLQSCLVCSLIQSLQKWISNPG